MEKFDKLEQLQFSLQQRLTQLEDICSSAGPEGPVNIEMLQVLETSNVHLVSHVQKLEVEHALLAH